MVIIFCHGVVGVSACLCLHLVHRQAKFFRHKTFQNASKEHFYLVCKCNKSLQKRDCLVLLATSRIGAVRAGIDVHSNPSWLDLVSQTVHLKAVSWTRKCTDVKKRDFKNLAKTWHQ